MQWWLLTCLVAAAAAAGRLPRTSQTQATTPAPAPTTPRLRNVTLASRPTVRNSWVTRRYDAGTDQFKLMKKGVYIELGARECSVEAKVFLNCSSVV
ncbi:unnamed protein product [Plutella xylostella]|uniref:(diamondback moth) hypothetical protein n=1 Tax=Plutella xylostella TaxID=51655 RepID=A0A8S4GA99_PLUXY|nr:unnamed protein product [Plutella xylostella]